ncbi:hypothetical protein V6Z11_A08G146800 [Gossypium hirsutum]
MVQEKVKVSTLIQTRHWKCVESSTDSKALYYGRFILALLGELEGTCITHAKFDKIPHEYSTIELYGTRNTFICAKGPRYVTTQNIILPPSMEIVDNTPHVANLTEPIDLCIGLQIERNRGYGIKMPKNFQDRSYPIDVVFMHVQNANHSIHCYGNDNEKHKILFLEIWTNGKENLHLENNQHDKKEIALKYIFIDQSKLPSRIDNCLKKSNIHKLLDLLNYSREDLMKIEHFRIEDK